MTEMIDEYNARKIKEFWMGTQSTPLSNMNSNALIESLIKRIEQLEKELAKFKEIKGQEMTTENNKPTEKDLQDAAQCWCDTRVSGREMDAFLATVFAEKLAATRLETLKLREVKELRYAVERALTLKPDMPNREWFESVINDFDALIKKLEGK